jgi:hypothetical protein
MKPLSQGERVAFGLGVLILLLGSVAIAYVCAKNYPGDAGPVVGPGAADKIRYIVAVGPMVIVAAASVTAIGLWLARRH